MSALANDLIRLAYNNPNLREGILSTLGISSHDSYDEGYDEGAYDGSYDDRLGATARKLMNPINSGCSPLQKGRGERREGDCYRKHHEYGEADSGEPGSQDRKDYMVEYRKQYSKKTGPTGGSATRDTWVPANSGMKYNKQTGERVPAEKSASAYSDEDFQEDIQTFLKMADYRKSPERKVLNNKCQKSFKKNEDNTQEDIDAAISDYPTDGECYQKWHEYGQADSGAPKSAKRKEYYKRYYQMAYKGRKKTEGTNDGSIKTRKIVPKPPTKTEWGHDADTSRSIHDRSRSKARKEKKTTGGKGVERVKSDSGDLF